VYQISREWDNAFAFYGSFTKKPNNSKKPKKLSQNLEGSYLGNTLVKIWNVWW